ncbi:MAG: LamG domain-containing protein, partial [Candidatus Micrarchaeia archaeon]
NNLSKNELVVNGSNLVRSYSIAMKLNRTCAGGNCANATLGGGQPKVDNSTRALWHFDEESGTTVYDSSGNGNTGNFYGTPSRVGGRFLAALQFVASDHDHVVVNDSNSLDITGSFTVELWFRQPDVTSLAWLLNKANTTNHNDSNYAIWIDADNKIRGSIADGAGDQNLTSTTIVQPNRWYHVAFTADGTTLKIYINGVLENSTYQTITPAANSLDLLIGARSTTAMYHFNGTIDEVAIYSRAKSAEEIAADANLFHWDWGPIAINNNLSAAWHFNEGTGNFTYDSSGNSNMITFTGSETIILTPSSIHKAYNINSTYADDPFLATAEMNYSKIDESDDIRESSSASYSNTLTRPCQAAGTCSCTGSEIMCWTFEACVASNCGYTCPAVGNASNTGNSCTISASGCSQGCAYCAE